MLTEVLGVAGERRRTAGDVDHAAGGGLRNGLEHGLVAALARGIDDDHVRTQAVLRDHARQKLLRRTDVERRVGDAVAGGVRLRVLDSLRDNLDADHAAGMAREQQ